MVEIQFDNFREDTEILGWNDAQSLSRSSPAMSHLGGYDTMC